MHVLFISSGTSGCVRPVVKSQGEMLRNKGLDISYFLIKGNGVFGYVKNIFRLRRVIKRNQFDIIHAHYSLTAFVATLSRSKPLIVSLMGSDLEINRFFTFITRLLAKYWWSCTIVKSDKMAKKLKAKNVHILPNGVDMEQFKPLNVSKCRKQLGWVKGEYHALFAANPKRPVKNYQLFTDAVSELRKNGYRIQTHVLDNVSHDKIPIYMNAADVVCLSSFREGSPNVVKEAMSCNRPVVSTDVGDVTWLFGGEDGYFTSGLDIVEYALNLESALKFSKKYQQTVGRNRIQNLGLNADSFNNKIIELYKTVR